jgi:hypothetical protein
MRCLLLSVLCTVLLQTLAGVLQGNAAIRRTLQDDAAASYFPGFVHVSDLQQLAARAAHMVKEVLPAVEANMLALTLARDQQQQPREGQELLDQQQQMAAAMTQRQGQQHWERWQQQRQQQQQQQQAGDVWVPSSLGLPDDRYHSLLEQVAMVAEVRLPAACLFCL